MTHQMTKASIIIGNLVVISPFVGAFIWPERYVYFVYNTAILIFVIEFFSFHSALMIHSHKANKQKVPLFVIAVYIFFVLLFSVGLAKSPYPLIIFIIRLFIKLLSPAEKHANQRNALANPLVRQALLFMAVIFVVIFLEPLLRHLPLSDTILSQRPVESGSLFGDTPQTVLVWGILYFGLDALIDIKYSLKNKLNGSKTI